MPPKTGTRSKAKPLSREQYAALKASLARTVVRGSGAYRLRRPKLRGRGAYTYDNPGPWGQIGRVAGGYIGAGAGHMLSGGYTPAATAGAMIGSKLGGMAHYAGRLFGSGAYGVSGAPAMLAPTLPEFSNGKDYIEVCRTEYLMDIISSATPGSFSLQDFYLNPGLQSTFPWLSSVCGCNFQQYKFSGLVFEFRSFSSPSLNSTNTALGSVVCAIDYDSTSATFQNRNEMENTGWSRSYAPCETFLIPVECARAQTAIDTPYIRTGSVPSGSDQKMYDWGRLSIATVGCQGASVNLGSLYVTYKIRLYKPITMAPLQCALVYNAGLSGVTSALPLGTTRNTVINNMGTVTATGTTLTLDRTALREGMVFCLMHFVANDAASSVAVPAAPSISVTGMTLITTPVQLNSDGVDFLNSTTGLNGTGSVVVGYYRVSRAGTIANPVITFGTFTCVDAPTFAQVSLHQVYAYPGSS